MRVVKSPYFVMKCEFAAEAGEGGFAGFLDYISREEVKAHIMEKIKVDGAYEFKNSKIKVNEEMFYNYINYATRRNALMSKGDKITPDEIASLEFLNKKNEELTALLKEMKNSKPAQSELLKRQLKEQKKLQTGAFDFYHDDLTEEQLNHYKAKFFDAEINGSILYKDVMSFSTEGLIRAGVYNPYTDELNRKPLIEASRRMLKEMYKHEGLDASAISVAEIHYNTNHFHIHLATVESENTRRMILYEGKTQAKGMRKESTLQAMKSTFASYIFDRSQELERISKLRDGLRKDIKQQLFTAQDEKTLSLLSTIKQALPDNKRNWNMKQLSKNDYTYGLMVDLINQTMAKHPEFNQFKRLSRFEDDQRKLMYGKLAKNQTSFYEGRMHGKGDGLYYRLGSSVLEQLRNSEGVKQKNKRVARKAVGGDRAFYVESNSPRQSKIERTLSNARYEIRKLEYSVDDGYKKYKVELEREKVEHDIERAKWEQSLS